jgi:hypothetical protein
VHRTPMVAEAEIVAGLGGEGEGEGEVVEAARPGVESKGFSVEAAGGVGAEEGVGEENQRRVEQSIEQVLGMEWAAACTVRKEEKMKVVVVAVIGCENERVKFEDGGGRERGWVL